MLLLIPLASFFFHDTTTTSTYPLSLHDALPISSWLPCWSDWSSYYHFNYSGYRWRLLRDGRRWRSPSRRSQIGRAVSRNAETDLVCRLLLEKKKRWGNRLLPRDTREAGRGRPGRTAG